MQFPVPQFTDVEDRIIANLTLRQFGILFTAGVIVFLFYSATKNVIGTIVVFLLVGVPSLLIAFMHVNGRPLYKVMSHLVGFFIQPRQMLFHKQGLDSADLKMYKAMEPVAPKPTGVPAQAKSLSELNAMLEKQRLQEKALIDKYSNKDK